MGGNLKNLQVIGDWLNFRTININEKEKKSNNLQYDDKNLNRSCSNFTCSVLVGQCGLDTCLIRCSNLRKVLVSSRLKRDYSA